MNSREKVIRTIEFKNPDKIPIELCLHTATRLKYGRKLPKLPDKYPQDIEMLEWLECLIEKDKQCIKINR